MSEGTYVPPPPPPPPQPPPAALDPGGAGQAPGGAPQFDFIKPFAFVFEDPRWAPKILIGGLFYLASIFIIGLFFVLGYAARVARNVVAGVERPLPEWEEIGDFFLDGLRLVGVAAVYILPFVAIAITFAIPAGILGAIENEGIQALGSGVAGCLACLMVPLTLTMLFFMPASLLFAAVEQRFSAGFEFSRIWPFIKANIGNYLLAIVIWLIARFIGGMGVVLLCIGVVFTSFWAFLITAHALGQVYRLARTK